MNTPHSLITSLTRPETIPQWDLEPIASRTIPGGFLIKPTEFTLQI